MSDSMNVGNLLTDQLDRLFEKSVTREVLTQAEAGALPQALWEELENIGVTLALVTEDAGGVGLGNADAEGVWRAIGYHAAPVPLGDTMIGRWALAEAGLDIPEGPLAVIPQPLQLDASGRLAGGEIAVPWAEQVDHLVAIALQGDEPTVCLLRRAGILAKRQASISRIPSARLVLTAVQPSAQAPLPALTSLGLLPNIAVLRATQMSGCLDRLLALCIEYGNTRVQFGKPIGKFQAVQHMIATLAESAAAAQVAGRMGCRGLDRSEVEFGAAVAKIRVGKSANECTAIAHQVFGAMGVTDEHTLHFFTRRLWQWRDEGQTEHWWAERLGRKTIQAGGNALWPALVD
ncbi:MAG: acyl-CoA dehydrogenase [Rhodocyclaceae bacterium]|jgi:acyl-CoA dehydrogenase|nr:acyl-CoA dehydrogenase [Rhodocyclaceae bacterium]